MDTVAKKGTLFQQLCNRRCAARPHPVVSIIEQFLGMGLGTIYLTCLSFYQLFNNGLML